MKMFDSYKKEYEEEKQKRESLERSNKNLEQAIDEYRKLIDDWKKKMEKYEEYVWKGERGHGWTFLRTIQEADLYAKVLETMLDREQIERAKESYEVLKRFKCPGKE
jgi:hypothetical protein